MYQFISIADMISDSTLDALNKSKYRIFLKEHSLRMSGPFK